nr:hypothetical protein [Tanacetum cinerariifolium]
MVQTRNNPDNSGGANDSIATQLVAIAAKLEAMESLKEDVAELKRQAATKKRSSGGENRYEEVESNVTAIHLARDALDLLYFWNLKTHAKGFCPPVFISSASVRESCIII